MSLIGRTPARSVLLDQAVRHDRSSDAALAGSARNSYLLRTSSFRTKRDSATQRASRLSSIQHPPWAASSTESLAGRFPELRESGSPRRLLHLFLRGLRSLSRDPNAVSISSAPRSPRLRLLTSASRSGRPGLQRHTKPPSGGCPALIERDAGPAARLAGSFTRGVAVSSGGPRLRLRIVERSRATTVPRSAAASFD